MPSIPGAPLLRLTRSKTRLRLSSQRKLNKIKSPAENKHTRHIKEYHQRRDDKR